MDLIFGASIRQVLVSLQIWRLTRQNQRYWTDYAHPVNLTDRRDLWNSLSDNDLSWLWHRLIHGKALEL
jgi:hypothetical protein